MAIGFVMLYWLGKLHERGVFRGNCVLDPGLSNVTASEGICEDFLQRLHVQNRGTALTNKEHIFNMGQCLKTLHDHLVVGGCVLQVLPTRCYFNHGFYNIHSTFYRELAEVNDYEIVDLAYVSDHQQQNMTVANEQNLRGKRPARPLDISKRDNTSRELEFALEAMARHCRRLPRQIEKNVYRIFHSVKAAGTAQVGAVTVPGRACHPIDPNISPPGALIRRTLGEDVEVYDYNLAMLRNRRDVPLRYPQQGACCLLMG
jgi:hypothetical protein